ncbi:MAG TPA: TetR/AcrR family transcriptional regulator [Methylomirabilota bacterium]|nr:TetR/AcrR family transcriptional regulator [Methylomirabilota bacterium]
MRVQEPRRRPRLTVENILAESARLFNQRGYHGTSLTDIARALGVSKAALYYHVKSKEDIVFRCYQRVLDLGMEGLDHAHARAAAPDEELTMALHHFIRGLTDQWNGAVVLLDATALSPQQHARVVRRRDEYERGLRDIIREGIAAGVFMPYDPKLVGFAILGALNWILRWYDPAGPRSSKEVAEVLSSYLVRGLQAHPADRRDPGAPSSGGAGD